MRCYGKQNRESAKHIDLQDFRGFGGDSEFFTFLPDSQVICVCYLLNILQLPRVSDTTLLQLNVLEVVKLRTCRRQSSIFKNERREQSQAVHQKTSFPKDVMYAVHLQMAITPSMFSYAPSSNL